MPVFNEDIPFVNSILELKQDTLVLIPHNSLTNDKTDY